MGLDEEEEEKEKEWDLARLLRPGEVFGHCGGEERKMGEGSKNLGCVCNPLGICVHLIKAGFGLL